MRSLRTANSLTSRNIASAPPAHTLMLYHYSVARESSQGTWRVPFALGTILSTVEDCEFKIRPDFGLICSISDRARSSLRTSRGVRAAQFTPAYVRVSLQA